MLQGFGLARLGRDAEVIETRDGNIVARLSLAFDVYAKGEKVTQWVEGSLWGKQAESLQEYLLKGKQVAEIGGARRQGRPGW
jgi:single-strand DNA-binding protein